MPDLLTPEMIRYPRYKALHADIRTCQAISKLGGEPQCMALEGITGTGKTTLVRDYTAAYPREECEDGAYVPVLYMGMPSPATVKGTASKLLECLGDPAADRGTLFSLDQRLINFLPACGVTLVILDDFHHLIDCDSDKVIGKVSEWLKVLIKEAGVPFLVVGIEGRVERVLQANSQLSRLFAVRETLAPFTQEDAAGQAEWHYFVHYAELLVGVSLSCGLPRAEILGRLHYATLGVAANLLNLFRGASQLGSAAGSEVLSLETLSRTFDKRLSKHVAPRVNPFTLERGAVFTPPTQRERPITTNPFRHSHELKVR